MFLLNAYSLLTTNIFRQILVSEIQLNNQILYLVKTLCYILKLILFLNFVDYFFFTLNNLLLQLYLTDENLSKYICS